MQLAAGLKRYREAIVVLEEGLKLDPFNPYIKVELEVATQGNLADLLEGLPLPLKYTARMLAAQLPHVLLKTYALCLLP